MREVQVDTAKKEKLEDRPRELNQTARQSPERAVKKPGMRSAMERWKRSGGVAVKSRCRDECPRPSGRERDKNREGVEGGSGRHRSKKSGKGGKLRLTARTRERDRFANKQNEKVAETRKVAGGPKTEIAIRNLRSSREIREKAEDPTSLSNRPNGKSRRHAS